MNERHVEIPWILAKARSPILDIGCTESQHLARLTGPVDGLDIRSGACHGLRNQYVGDVRCVGITEEYQTITAISTFEHIGMPSSFYGTEGDDEEFGDRNGLVAASKWLRPDGQILMTVPFGRALDYGWFRQYDRRRLVRLCAQFSFNFEVWAKDDNGEWLQLPPNLIGLAENLEYDLDGHSARAVALVTVTL